MSDNTIKAESLGDFFKISGKKGLNVSKKMAENPLKNALRFLDLTANVATAAASGSPKAALSTILEVIIFYHTGKRLYLGKFV